MSAYIISVYVISAYVISAYVISAYVISSLQRIDNVTNSVSFQLLSHFGYFHACLYCTNLQLTMLVCTVQIYN